MTTIAFVDTETTGLDRQRHHVWDIGIILRRPDEPDVEYSWLVRPDLSTADPGGLRVGRYYERIGFDLNGAYPGTACRVVHPDGVPGDGQTLARTTTAEIAAELAPLLDGATIVGAVPDFDDAMLGRFLREHGQAPTWHYHLVDVETLAAGQLRKPPPWNFDELLSLYDLTYDEADRHTAIGDARMARDLYDRVLGREPKP